MSEMFVLQSPPPQTGVRFVGYHGGIQIFVHLRRQIQWGFEQLLVVVLVHLFYFCTCIFRSERKCRS